MSQRSFVIGAYVLNAIFFAVCGLLAWQTDQRCTTAEEHMVKLKAALLEDDVRRVKDAEVSAKQRRTIDDLLTQSRASQFIAGDYSVYKDHGPVFTGQQAVGVCAFWKGMEARGLARCHTDTDLELPDGWTAFIYESVGGDRHMVQYNHLGNGLEVLAAEGRTAAEAVEKLNRHRLTGRTK